MIGRNDLLASAPRVVPEEVGNELEGEKGTERRSWEGEEGKQSVAEAFFGREEGETFPAEPQHCSPDCSQCSSH